MLQRTDSPQAVWKSVCIPARAHPLPLSSISHWQGFRGLAQGWNMNQAVPISRINHFSFKLLVFPQSTELGQKFWNLFSKKNLQLGKNVSAGEGRRVELGRRLLKL